MAKKDRRRAADYTARVLKQKTSAPRVTGVSHSLWMASASGNCSTDLNGQVAHSNFMDLEQLIPATKWKKSH